MPRWREGCSSISEELLRVAYVTAVPFIPRFIFLAPCSPSPPSSSFLFLRWKRPTNPRRPSTVKRGTAIPTESKKKEEEIFLHTRWGVIARHNVTNFQLLRGSPSLPHPPPPKRCPNAHLNRPRSHPSPPPPPFPSLPFSSRRINPREGDGDGVGWGSTFSTKHGRPPRSPGDRFFPRTIYSFTFYSHRAFDNSWMAGDKLVSPSPIIFPFLSAPGGDVVGWFEERRVFSRVVRACCFLANFFFLIIFFFFSRTNII